VRAGTLRLKKGSHLLRHDDLLERLENNGFAFGLDGALSPERFDSELNQPEHARVIHLKFGKLQTPGPKIDRQKILSV